MSSKRRFRRRSCEGKQRHDSYKQGKKHLQSLVLSNKAYGLLNVYHCKFCKGWHVGRVDKRTRQAIKAKREHAWYS